VKTVRFDVPQKSVLGPLLVLLYTADLEIIARQSGVEAHLYSDDSQLYLFSTLHDMESAERHLLCCLDESALCHNSVARQSRSVANKSSR